MAIVAECPACGKRFKADEKQAGKKAKCSQCANVFVIAAPATPKGATAPAVAVEPAAAPTRSAATTGPGTKITSDGLTARSPAKVPTPAKPAVRRRPRADDDDDMTLGVQALPETSSEPPSAPATPPGPRTSEIQAPAASQATPTTIIDPPQTATDQSTLVRPAGGIWKWAVVAAVFAVCAGAAAGWVGPKVVNRIKSMRMNAAAANGSAPPMAKAGPSANLSGAKRNVASASPNAPLAVPVHLLPVVAPAVPKTGAAWSTQADVAAPKLKLPDDFRLAMPGEPPLRHNPNSLVLSPPPGGIAAVTLLPDADGSAPTIQVWNLFGSKTAQFKLNQPLAFPILSPDGNYYAGQVFDDAARVVRVELWATLGGARAYSIDVPATAPFNAPVALGFPIPDQVALYGEKLAVWDLNSKQPVREVGLRPRSDDSRAAASARLKLVAVADSRQLTMVDLAQGKVLGSTPIPDAVVAHPHKRLTLRAMEFSPSGTELALAFDNRQSTRRIAIYDVATGTLKALHAPAAPFYAVTPQFEWGGDSQSYVVGGGILIDRASGRQIGQVHTDSGDEGLGGVLAGLLADDRALVVWDKYPRHLALRGVPIRRERPQWFLVDLLSATAQRFEQLQCTGREFGNPTAATASLVQTGRLTDGSRFLVVDAKFTAALNPLPDAPSLLLLRQDQFVLIADGQPRLPIGTLTSDGTFSLERPEYTLRRGEKPAVRVRRLVFAVTGGERSLALRIGPSAEMALPLPPSDAPAAPVVVASPPPAEHLAASLYAMPEEPTGVSAKVAWARVQPYELDPEQADYVPLRVTYTSPRDNASVLAVNFDLTVNTPRTLTRTSINAPPRFGLLLPDGTHLRPAVELPAPLPVTLAAGERFNHTCLFVLESPAARFRLTYDGTPIATVTPEASTARSTP